MVTTFIVRMVFGLVDGLLSLLPTWTLDTSSATRFSTGLGTTMGSINGYVPENLFFTCLGILLAVKLAMFAWRGFVFVYSMIPFN